MDKVYKIHLVQLGYNVIKQTEYFVSLWTCFVLTDEYYVKTNSKELSVPQNVWRYRRGVA